MADEGCWNRTALLVIGMQRDFIEGGGPMLVKRGKDIVPNAIKAVEVARQRGILIVWVVHEHDPLGRDVELFCRHLYKAGQVGPTSKGSAGAELVDGLIIREGDYKLVKTRFSAFFATHLHSVLQGAGINNLVITGVQTPNCSRQTVYDAVALDYQPVTVIVDATAAATPDIHLFNVFDMKKLQPQHYKNGANLKLDLSAWTTLHLLHPASVQFRDSKGVDVFVKLNCKVK